MATILFDIDRTLFNTDRFNREMHKTLVMLLGKSSEIINKFDQDYVASKPEGSNFIPEDYIHNLAEYFGSSEEIIHQSFFKRMRFTNCVYYDVYESIELLSRKHEIGIFSEGDEQFQKFKLGTLGLSLFLNPDLIIIEPNKTKNKVIAKIPDGSYVIDDSLIIIKKLIEFDKVNPILMNRDKKEIDSPVPMVSELEELYEIIK